jgi:hypothetical protein
MGSGRVAPPVAHCPCSASLGTAALSSTTDSYEDVTNVGESGNTTIDQVALGSALDQIPTATLSDAEVEGLLYMREEEKPARDVYPALFEKWGLPIFQNIADSEQTHTDAVKVLLDRYDLQGPVAEAGAGIFTNSTLQDLHDQLVAEGSQSPASALSVGAAIEEVDILDLEERIAHSRVLRPLPEGLPPL